ncbi:hypothetical protein RhiirC2_802016 [Rhizophagus irregularis]|uniref:Uncharacterized protein n=1 Tax=Rhizophagus irregularis TaxID=588596 RepID=A0A2N1M1V0_9GLOM|nr:hypothetical protein RhiirC2_802016 [Rhizophagus irregularis]
MNYVFKKKKIEWIEQIERISVKLSGQSGQTGDIRIERISNGLGLGLRNDLDDLNFKKRRLPGTQFWLEL